MPTETPTQRLKEIAEGLERITDELHGSPSPKRAIRMQDELDRIVKLAKGER